MPIDCHKLEQAILTAAGKGGGELTLQTISDLRNRLEGIYPEGFNALDDDVRGALIALHRGQFLQLKKYDMHRTLVL